MRLHVLIATVILIAVALVSSSQPPREQVGPLADGGFLLNSGWRVKPAGTQVPLDTLPMSSILSKNGRFSIVLNGGYNPPSLSVLDTKEQREIGRTPVPDAWLGLALSPNGRTLWVGGGSQAAVYEFSLSQDGKLTPTRTFEVVKGAQRSARDFIGDVAIDPEGHLLYACDLYHDAIYLINTQSGTVIDRFKTGRRPYRILFNPDGKSFYVTSWADGSLYHHQTSDGAIVQTLRLGAHPTDMVWRDRATRAEVEPDNDGDRATVRQADFKARIFVAAANTNNVYSVAVSDSGDLRTLEAINVSTTPNHPLGMTPSALALSPDQSRLFVVCSDANAAAVVDVTAARSQVLGFIPTGWYPTAAKVLPDGRLVVLNGKGSRSYPNPKGPSPARRESNMAVQYVAHIQTGSASFIPAITDESLAGFTDEVRNNSPYSDVQLDEVPPGIPAAIQHVLYIVKENRTYDQVLGDIGKGESDPSLCLFNERVGPNHHKLAREFVLFDNFYVNADVSADGHNWSTSAIANDFVQKNVAEQLRAPQSQLRFRRRRARRLPSRRLPMDERRIRRPFLAQLRLLGGEQERGRTGRHPDREGAGSCAVYSHQYEVSQLRPRLPGREARASVPGRPEGVRGFQSNAGADVFALAERSHLRHHARQDRPAFRLRR